MLMTETIENLEAELKRRNDEAWENATTEQKLDILKSGIEEIKAKERLRVAQDQHRIAMMQSIGTPFCQKRF